MATPNDIPARKPQQMITHSTKSEKPAFVRKPYLTQRPLKNDPRLMNLKKGLQG